MNKIRLNIAFVLLLLSPLAKAQVMFPNIDVQHYRFNITLNDGNDNLKGSAAITVKFLADVNQLQLNLIKKNSSGKGMLVSSVTENGKALKFTQDDDLLNITSTAKANNIYTYTINYAGVPADGLIISTNKFGHRTFFGDNWPNRAHNWLPCADYPSDKASLDMIVTAPDHYTVVANGIKVSETEKPGHLKTTHWQETIPLPTKVMIIGVADFAVQQSGTVDGVPVYSYVFPENKEQGFKSYAYAPEILAFYDKKIGPYDYKKLANVQSKTIFGGMENSSAIFYFENSVGDKGAEELQAHEIAHQWFGDAITEKSWRNLWLSEGFATYMTNYYLENKYGEDTLKTRMKVDRRKVLRFEKSRMTPVVDSAVTTNFTQLLNANSYEKGSWVLHMLRRKLGDSVFWRGIRNYYAQYKNRNDNTDEFRQVMEQISGMDLKPFFTEWLNMPGHPQLNIEWKYDTVKQTVEIHITQQQDNLYQLTLDIKTGKQLNSIDIKDKETTVSIPLGEKPESVIADPNVKLLASFELKELF